MSGGKESLMGPDLSLGVDVAEVTEGRLLAGHAGGDAVVVTRCGADLLAVGGTCTHYGAPLSDGLVVGDTVRCPWHHACFSLRTGEALRAPALNPVTAFAVEERGGKVFVLGKKPAPPPSATAPAATSAGAPAGPESVIIVGAGAAGNAAAEMLRRQGYAGRVTLIGADGAGPYDRPNLSKDFLAGTAPEDWIPLRPAEFYREHSLDLVVDATVEAIDPARKTITLAGGTTLAYGALLLATGADPVRLTLRGSDLPHVRYLRSLADSRAIIERAVDAKRAVVVGASFIGLEVAAALRARGIEVTVVAPETVPLARVMGDALGASIRRLHESRGVVFHLDSKPVAIEGDDVLLDGGARLRADLVVVGVGVRPAVGLAAAAGLTTDRGVVVDEQLRTSAPDVFAAGDIARWPDARTGERIRVEHWVVAERQGQVAARNILGQRERFDAVPFFWSAHYDTTISYVGHAESWDRVDVAGDIEARDCAVAFRRGRTTLAIATIGRDHASLQAEAAMERNDEAALRALVP
jgi:NADPH-dependent 2,4-dienoyl-CoA reductase/sulfur reductase-like enzyme/nitrite reductase/ring-hydroxylating ferredoxin subunit